MYSNIEIINYLQANKILALKLDHAVTSVDQQVENQIETSGKGATRILYYTSCFTNEYQDVCKQQKKEDIRFIKGVIHLLQHRNVIFDMIKIYFEKVFKYKTSEQIEYIKKMLMAANVHIAASSLSKAAFVFATAKLVAVGINLNLDLSAFIGRSVGNAITITSLYGVVQKAADSANQLDETNQEYYAALYYQELEMMYFLIEPLFKTCGAFRTNLTPSDEEIVGIITNMIRFS